MLSSTSRWLRMAHNSSTIAPTPSKFVSMLADGWELKISGNVKQLKKACRLGSNATN